MRKRGTREKFRHPDRFLRGGIEEQPESYQESGTIELPTSGNSAESTGGSSNDNADTQQKSKQFFKRQPLITETAALYQQSHVLTDT